LQQQLLEAAQEKEKNQQQDQRHSRQLRHRSQQPQQQQAQPQLQQQLQPRQHSSSSADIAARIADSLEVAEMASKPGAVYDREALEHLQNFEEVLEAALQEVRNVTRATDGHAGSHASCPSTTYHGSDNLATARFDQAHDRFEETAVSCSEPRDSPPPAANKFFSARLCPHESYHVDDERHPAVAHSVDNTILSSVASLPPKPPRKPALLGNNSGGIVGGAAANGALCDRTAANGFYSDRDDRSTMCSSPRSDIAANIEQGPVVNSHWAWPKDMTVPDTPAGEASRLPSGVARSSCPIPTTSNSTNRRSSSGAPRRKNATLPCNRRKTSVERGD